MRCRGTNDRISTCAARTAISSSSSRAKSGTCFRMSGSHAMMHLGEPHDSGNGGEGNNGNGGDGDTGTEETEVTGSTTEQQRTGGGTDRAVRLDGPLGGPGQDGG